MINVKEITREVEELLGDSGDGHGIDHVLRVRDMAVSFAHQEGADERIVELASLLHDVDDYKIFGEDSALNLTNATFILRRHNVPVETQSAVLDIVQVMGYNKYLESVRPTTIEGMVVSDADMCDAIGAEGILRTHAYALSKGNLFFDSTLSPQDAEKNADNYRATKKTHSVQHFFDKLLTIPSIMMTSVGRTEATKRQKIMVDFLQELFREENNPQWSKYLEDFTRKR